jgi:outer membrane protein TolC
VKTTTLSALSAALLLGACAVIPKPMTEDEFASFAIERMDRVTANQTPISGAVGLYEAMARALKYNLDARVEVMEAALRIRESDLSTYAMLPKLVASSGYTGRSIADASSKATQDTDIVDANLTLSWNILDFGLSYVRAKQTADKYLIQEERKRKTVNRVIEDVRTAYWRAVSYERLVGRMHGLERRVRGALADTRRLAASGAASPVAALTYERELIQIQRELEILEAQMNVSKIQLAALINIKPGEPFRLAIPKRKPAKLKLPQDLDSMFLTALTKRPEMREIPYDLRGKKNELDAALLDILPGINLFAGANYDSNEFINSNHWVTYGAKAGFNLLKVVTYPAAKRKIEAEETLIDQRSLSVAMAVMSQVHVSRLRFQHLSKAYGTASALAHVQGRLLQQVRAETRAERTSEQILIREEMNALVAEAKRDMAYADLQNAYANVYASIGVDPFPGAFDDSDDLKTVEEKLRALWQERGEYGLQDAAIVIAAK